MSGIVLKNVGASLRKIALKPHNIISQRDGGSIGAITTTSRAHWPMARLTLTSKI